MTKAITKTERKKLESFRRNKDNRTTYKSERHGLFASHFHSDLEREKYEAFVGNLINDLNLTLPLDIDQAELAGIYHIQIIRAFACGDIDTQEKAGKASRAHLAVLRATRETRGEEQVLGSSLCEVVSDFLADARAKGLIKE